MLFDGQSWPVTPLTKELAMTRTARPATHVWSTWLIADARRERNHARRLRDSIRTEVAIRRIELTR